MSYGIYVATSGAVARQNQLDVVASNLANADTVGFRAQQLAFEEVMRDDFEAPHRHMVAVTGNQVSHRPGPALATGDPLDVAVNGGGFFALGSPSAPRLVRSLHLEVSADGVVTDSMGRPVVGTEGIQRVRPDSPVQVTSGGELSQDGQSFGRIAVYSVVNERALAPVGAGAYVPTTESGPAFEVEGTVVSGALEGSNVDPLQSMVQLISLNRDFQSLTRAIRAYQEADRAIVQAARGQ